LITTEKAAKMLGPLQGELCDELKSKMSDTHVSFALMLHLHACIHPFLHTNMYQGDDEREE
jgi:hypothetical protein